MSPPKSTRQQLEKVPQVPCLYRHSLSRRYYGIKKVGGKRKEHSLSTTDRQLAERRLKVWIAGLGKVDREVEHLTLRELIVKLQKQNQGKADKTRATDASIVRKLEETWPYDLDMRVSDIRTSQLNEWLALHEKRLKHTSYNRYAGFLKQLFAIAVDDRVIVESPVDKLKTSWKRPQTPKRHVPTIAQFQAIVNHIRNQPLSDTAKDTADFVEFLGLAGVGQAEAAALTWGDIDWKAENICIRRRKTQKLYYVPFYPHLKFLLNQLNHKKPRGTSPSTKVFKIKDAKGALRGACERLKFNPPFSQRNIRQCLIQRLWQAGIDVKLISKWQGHQDGGKLILDTYTETFGSGDASYVEKELDKLAASSPVPSGTMGFISIATSRRNQSAEDAYEQRELEKLRTFDPEHPRKEGSFA
jgi:integrase